MLKDYFTDNNYILRQVAIKSGITEPNLYRSFRRNKFSCEQAIRIKKAYPEVSMKVLLPELQEWLTD